MLNRREKKFERGLATSPPEFEQPDEFFHFETYKNYISGLALYINECYGGSPDCFPRLKAAVVRQQVLPQISPIVVSGDFLEEIKKLLFNAWNTELVLVLPSSISREFTKCANHWSPVQAYYSIYLALQAYFRSCRLTPPKDHSAALSTIATHIRNQDLFPPFWNVCCDGEPTSASARYLKLPNGVSISQISPLTTPRAQDFWDRYGMLLRTTRQRQFEKKLKESGKQFRTKRGKPRKRFSPIHKAQVLDGLRPTTVFDFLYRLRVRSNYEDADAFILGTMSQTDAEEFNRGLCALTSTTLFLLELHITARIGGHYFSQFMDEFASAHPLDYSRKTIGARRLFLI